MSDGITDAYRALESSRLRNIVPEDLVANLREWLKESKKAIQDLRNLGYKVEYNDFTVKVYKEL